MASTQELEKKYSSQLSQLKAIFPSWDQADLAFTLQDARGNVDEAAMMITEGRASQFTQAGSKKKPVKAESKPVHAKGHSNRNADSGGWEQVNGGEAGVDSRAGRGGRGGARGGARGGRGGRGGEPFRGGRGGRGGIRGGRGGFAGAAGAAAGSSATAGEFPTSTDTTTEGWANQVEQATTAAASTTIAAPVLAGAWGKPLGSTSAAAAAPAPAAPAAPAAEASTAAPVADTSKGEDFSAAGGWGDAPSAKEIEKAAKSGGTDWQEEIKKPVQVAESSAAPALAPVKPKLTWAQIAKPQEKPKPVVPPPAPVAPAASEETAAPEEEAAVEPEPEAAQEEEQVPEQPIEALGDAPAEAEIEAEAEKVLSGEVQPEPARTEEAWTVDPAIAAVGGTGSQPSWAKSVEEPAPAESAPVAAPEPVTTYTGPPGFNTIASKTQASQPQAIRTNSRAALRHQKADESGVVLPPTLSSGLSSMEVQFGSLSFGSANPDGVDAPVPERAATPPAPAAPAVTSPIRSQPPAQTAAQPSAPSYYGGAQQQPAAAAPAATTPAQTQASTQQPSFSPHQTLQQQMHAYQAQQNQWQTQQPIAQPQQPQHQQQQHDSLHHLSQHQPQQPPQAQQQQQQGFYRGGQDYYGTQAAEAQQPQSQAQQQQQQQQQQPSHLPQASSYDAGFGAFGASHLFGGHQSQQHQASDYGHRSYDSYAASGYPRPPVEEPKQTPAQSHSSNPGQPQVPNQQSPYYNQMNYYQAPYNPYYQYGQGPSPGFQPYYPLAQRGAYGHAQAPQAPSAPVQQQNTKPNQPATQSPYGQPSSYPSNSYDDQTFGNFGRFGGGAAASDNKGPSSSGLTAQQSSGLGSSYGTQGQQGGLHGYLGGMNAQSASSGGRPDDSFNSKAGGAGAPGQQAAAGGRPQPAQQQQQPGQPGQQGQQGQQAPQLQQQQQHLQQQQHQHQQQGSAQAYGGYGGYGNQDWSQYGYGNARNGYSHWQQ